MTAVPATAVMWTYPWDLADERPARALDAIAGVAGMDGVALAASYHLATYFLPHNPVRPLYYGEDGMVLFRPNDVLYSGSALRPRVSDTVTGGDYLPRLVEAVRERGLEYTAWLVYCYNHYLARTHPACAKQDALGNRYLSQLCPAHPDVRAYFLALTRDVLEQTRPDHVYVESLSYLRYDYGFLNPKVLSPIGERCGFLLGLCFCPHCRAAAGEQGVDAGTLADEIAGYLRAHLPLLPSEFGADPGPADAAWQREVFGGRLRAFLGARAEKATSLFEELAAMIRRSGARVGMNVPHAGAVAVSGLLPERVVPLLDRARVGFPDAGAEHALAAQKGLLTPGAELHVSTRPAQSPDGDSYVGRISACRAAGADVFSAYNYGLLRPAHLRWCGRAASAFRAAGE